MRLGDLIDPATAGKDVTVKIATENDWSSIDVTGLSADSRTIEPGYLFAALLGRQSDGRAFIPHALSQGAAAVLAPLDTDVDTGPAPLLLDENPRRRLALLAARFHGRQPETIAAVTGTNGKTSVASFTGQIWARLGHRSALMGTLGVSAVGFEDAPPLTTPDPVALHRILRALADAGVRRVVMEASSHGLDQYRLDGVALTAAAFTNLTQDHLDYHGSMAAYLEAKARLFTLPPRGATAVLNADSPTFEDLARRCEARGLNIFAYGRTEPASGRALRLVARETTPVGQLLTLALENRIRQVDLPLGGAFQADNALCALGLAIACGADPDRAVEALSHLVGAPGRLERIGQRDNDAACYVDYAHTPDALETVLAALRPHCTGDLWVVFGCGGDRDRGKRPHMGEIAARLADRVIVTDDNPRTENPAAIRAEILTGAQEAREIGDRRWAIHQAVAGLTPGDLLVVAGKGHESGQIIGDEALPFDDREEVRAALGESA